MDWDVDKLLADLDKFMAARPTPLPTCRTCGWRKALTSHCRKWDAPVDNLYRCGFHDPRARDDRGKLKLWPSADGTPDSRKPLPDQG